MTLGHYTVSNVEHFQYFMYRPLYWFGSAKSVTVDERLSLAHRPAFSDHERVVTISLKPYRWSDGERVDARDVLFWLNIWHAEPQREADWVPGGLSIPTIVKAVHLGGPTKIVLALKRSVNPTWFLYNDLSTITPLPLAWTRTAVGASPGSASCAHARFGTGDKACTDVYVFLSEESGFDPLKPTARVDMLSTFAANALWQVVDGPWRLESYAATAPAVFVANGHYSGPNKPRIARFVEEPFASTAAELHALESGSVDVGYLPAADLVGATSSPLVAGSNDPALGRHYRLKPVYYWGIRYWSFNFRSTGDTGHAGAIFRQLYLRQAMQLLIDEPALIRTLAHGYAFPSDGPVPLAPSSPFLSKLERTDPYPYDPRRAEALLRSHGWSVTPGGIDVCERPGTEADECGTGIPAGTKLSLDLVGFDAHMTPLGHGLVVREKKTWSQAGIHVTIHTEGVEEFAPSECPKGCTWEITALQGNWIYIPDIYPSGEDIFSTTTTYGYAYNRGLFVTSRNTTLIKATDTTRMTLGPWENYIAKQLPFLFQPQFAQQFSEIDKSLDATPPGPLEELTPATWRWKS